MKMLMANFTPETQTIYGDELLEPFDFEIDSTPPEQGGTTECGD